MEEVLNEIPDTNIELTPAECDLANLVSIKNFVSTTLKEENSLDVVCYNAGIACNTAASECLRTKEGFELTVGTNHFGHFYLNQLILPKVRVLVCFIFSLFSIIFGRQEEIQMKVQ
mmetsp:Transcript_23693/g.34490  ORF Transcript_23693/g.34490 Transcript_23693/m.34490 type:complete len:116 (-) Transcript_23693:219-566(-)